MSIASEITRIQTAKENIRTSIINKGGTLSSDALIDDYATAIDAIPTSSGTTDYGLGVLIYEGTFANATSTFSVTTLPNGESFSFDKIVVELSNVFQGQNVNKRTYWRSDMPMTGYNEPLILDSGSNYRQNATYHALTTITIEDDTYIGLSAQSYDENNPTTTWSTYQHKAHGGYDKITGYGWWSWNCPAGAHIKITGYKRKSLTLITKNITVNGTYTASNDNADGYSSVTVNVQNQGTLIYEGTFSEVTSTFAVTTLPNGDSFSFDKIIIELTNMGQGYNSDWRQYWRKELPMTGNTTYMINNGVNYLANATALKTISIMEIEDANYITLKSFGYDVDAPTTTKASYSRVLYDTYDKITAYGWWSWSCPTGTHIKITGYNN